MTVSNTSFATRRFWAWRRLVLDILPVFGRQFLDQVVPLVGQISPGTLCAHAFRHVSGTAGGNAWSVTTAHTAAHARGTTSQIE